jgi:hypothetical protein
VINTPVSPCDKSILGLNPQYNQSLR